MRKNRPSRTAPKVAAAVLYLAANPRYAPLLPAGLSEATERLLTAAGALKPKHLERMGKPWYQWLTRTLEAKTSPGHLLYLGLRKRFVQDEVETALAEGATQVLMLGAGMDTLCLRLAPEYPEVTFLEVDHPASQGAKRGAVERIGAERPNLRFLAADLEAGGLAEALAAFPGWRGDARTVVVAEGLLIFLSPEAVDRLFATVRPLGTGSRFAFSYGVHDDEGRFKLGPVTRFLQGAALKAMGEGLRWGVREGELAAELEARGFRPVGPPERTDLRMRYLVPAGLDGPLGGFETVALAEPVPPVG